MIELIYQFWIIIFAVMVVIAMASKGVYKLISTVIVLVISILMTMIYIIEKDWSMVIAMGLLVVLWGYDLIKQLKETE